MDEVKINVNHGGRAIVVQDDVGVPDFVEQSLWRLEIRDWRLVGHGGPLSEGERLEYNFR